MHGMGVRSVLLLAAVRVRVLCEHVVAHSASASPLARAFELHLLCRDAGFCMILGCTVGDELIRAQCLRLCAYAALVPFLHSQARSH